MGHSAAKADLDQIRAKLSADIHRAIRIAQNSAVIAGLDSYGNITSDIASASHDYITNFLSDAFFRIENVIDGKNQDAEDRAEREHERIESATSVFLSPQ